MKSILTSLHRDTQGATTIEYALICGMIVIVIVGAIRGLGSENGGLWRDMSSKATTAMADATN